MAKPTSAREDLIQSAVELFRARGYEGVGVADLLAHAGAPRGSLYFHFPGGKEEIGAEALIRAGASVTERLRALRESGVSLESFIDIVFKTTARESKERGYQASCPLAAIATEVSKDNPSLCCAISGALTDWEREIALAATSAGMNKKNSEIFASAFVTTMEGALVVSKAQRSALPHANAAHAVRALARALLSA
jgi:TetR/AcrR family transcriptional repressor of lmrAB and yxaGH operons